MDTICGIGLPELIILALVGFVVVGPERSRELAVSLGRFLRTAMKSSWWKEFNQVAAAIRDLPTTLVRMAELEDELRTVRTDLERATHIDFNQAPGSPAGEQPAAGADPWGVLPKSPPPPTAEGQPAPADDEQVNHA